MDRTDKSMIILKNLTLFFGGFLLATDVFFLIFGIVYDLPLIRYVIYAKLVVNTTNLFLIIKKHYLVSTLIIYIVILAMMIAGVISMGTRPAFQLYGLGMIACISYNGYLHKRLLKKELPMALLITVHVLAYAGVYLFARLSEPLYSVPQSAIDILVVFNSTATFCIVILYICLFHNVAISSEEMLEKMAMIDNLTGLYNRHYLLESLEKTQSSDANDSWLALVDIDDFKMVNDTYGHNCGDYVLHRTAELIKQTCGGCIVCRWGGEEFVILSAENKCVTDILERLRTTISGERFEFDGEIIHITVTVGASRYDSAMTTDSWISSADEKLYYGKNNGKDQVVL